MSLKAILTSAGVIVQKLIPDIEFVGRGYGKSPSSRYNCSDIIDLPLRPIRSENLNKYGWQTGLLAFSPGSRGLVKIPTTSLGLYTSRCDSSHTRGASALDPSGLLVPFKKNAPASEDPSICP